MSSGALRTLLQLAAPMVLARAVQSVDTFADVLQIKHLGHQAIAATATGGLNVMGLIILATGTVFIVQSFVSQLSGRGDHDQTPRFAWYGLAIALLSGIVALTLIPIVGPALDLTGYSPEVRDQMTDYMAIRLLSIGAVVGVEALGNWYGGLGNTWMQMVAGLIMTVANIFFNWMLIDGHLGAPALGVSGAAWSSTIAAFLGLAFLVIAFWQRRGRAPAARSTQLSVRELGRVLRFGIPNGLNWFLEFAAFQLFVNTILASMGDETIAALNVVLALNSVAFMPAFGLASAGAILAGQAIGSGARDRVWPWIRVTLLCTMTWMGAIGVVYLLFPEQLLSLFTSEHTGRLAEIGVTMLVISTAWQLADAIGITLSEALRAAGDTTWIAAARLILAWAVFMPAAYLIVESADTGPVGAMLCLVGYLALLALALAWRFRSGAWKRIELIEPKLV